MVAYRRFSPRLAVIGSLAMVLGSALVVGSPRGAAAIPTVTLSLSVKPTWIEFGGTFTLTATITPSGPVTGLVRVAINSEHNLAFGHMHGCIPACTLDYAATAVFDLDGLTGKTTVKALWTDEGQTDEPTFNRFNVGISAGDVNVYNPPDWVKGYIGGPPPTATPKPTRRPTPAPTSRPVSTPSATATATPSPTATASVSATPTADLAPTGGQETPAADATTASVETQQTTPVPAPDVGEASTSIPIAIPIVLLIVVLAVPAFALRRLRGLRSSPNNVP